MDDITENSTKNQINGSKKLKIIGMKEDEINREKSLSNINVNDLSSVNRLAINTDVKQISENITIVAEPSKDSRLPVASNIDDIKNSNEINPDLDSTVKRPTNKKEKLLAIISNYHKFNNEISNIIKTFKPEIYAKIKTEVNVLNLVDKNHPKYHSKNSELKYLKEFLEILNSLEYMVTQYLDILARYENKVANEALNVDNLMHEFVGLKSHSFDNIMKNTEALKTMGFVSRCEMTKTFYDELQEKIFNSIFYNDLKENN